MKNDLNVKDDKLIYIHTINTSVLQARAGFLSSISFVIVLSLAVNAPKFLEFEVRLVNFVYQEKTKFISMHIYTLT